MKIITSKTCGLCRNVERKLQAKGISVEHVDIEDDYGKNFLSKNGIMSLPVLVINDNEYYVSNDALVYVNKNL